MTQQQAKEQLKRGNKVSHYLFRSNEFVQLVNGELRDENNVQLSWMGFFKHKQSSFYQAGWIKK
jgi:hypothetical protein